MPEQLDLTRDWTVDELGKVLNDLEARSRHDIDWRRFQILDGTLLVSPSSRFDHGRVLAELTVALRAAIPDPYVITFVGVDIERSYLVPDLVVAPRSAGDGNPWHVPPAGFPLAVEIVSPTSATMDRVTKPALYAGAQIAHYWRVETKPHITITAYDLAGDAYREVGTWGPGETMTLTQPFPLTVSLDELNR